MPTHALLGATGGTGAAVLRALLAAPPTNLNIKILVRSKSKLLTAFPNLEKTQSAKISIIEAPITDYAALQSCLSGAEVVHMCIATNEAKYGTRIAQYMAEAIISSLAQLRKDQGPKYIKPTILVLRSETLNPVHAQDSGKLVYPIVSFTLHYLYDDLDKAAKLYTAAAAENSGFFDYIFVDPPALHDTVGAECTGHELLVDGSKRQSASLNYSDLGAAYVELAERRGEYNGKSVAISATGAVREQWSVLLWYNLQGLKARLWG